MSIITIIPVSIILGAIYFIFNLNGKIAYNYVIVMLFIFIWTFFGGIISWLASLIFAKFLLDVRIIKPDEKDPMLAKVAMIVKNTAIKAGLKNIPQTGFYKSNEINALASGPFKNYSLIAVSNRLINEMNDDQIEGVIAHEISHIQQGDTETMTIMQGAVNAEILFMSFIICSLLGIPPENAQTEVYAFEVFFGLFGLMAVSSFSRRREFRADEGSARLAGKEKIISALKALQKDKCSSFDSHTSMSAFKICGNTESFFKLLATHPPIEERIKRLEELQY